MRNPEKDAVEQEKRKQAFLEHGFAMFSNKGIEAIRLQDVAKASGYGIATLYRYFNSKVDFAIAISEWKWSEVLAENRKRRPTDNFEGKSAADMFSFYLESFLEIYRKNKALLRFNQFFNVYIQSEDIDADALASYRGLMKPITGFFHEMYVRAGQDHTVRTDVPEEEMLSTTLHLMLAAVTRYAVGLVYQPESGFDEIRELETLKELLMMKYTTRE